MLPLLALVSSRADLPPFPREFRAAWVATVDNIDWPTKRTLSTPSQQREMRAILDRAAALKLNAIILQVRTSGDALYRSPIEPWSEYLTGRSGRAPNPRWDPLEYAVREAHARGIELHAWINPYRAHHPAQKGPHAANHLSRTNPSLVKPYGRFRWMDPGEPLVQKRIVEVTRDLVRRYDLDGLHIDDYFYPYPVAGLAFPDDASYAAYRRRGGRLARDDWRRKNVDDAIQAMYRTIKAEKPWVKFGISPFGVYRPGVPEGIKAGVDQYAGLYADARKWLREGWCDYFTPQLYWPIRQTPQSFPRLLDYWLSENRQRRHIWPGLFTSRTLPTEGNWPAREIVDQTELIRDRGADGEVHFSMKALQRNANNVADALRGGPYAEYALVPASPWIDRVAPPAPVLRHEGGDEFTWSPGDKQAVAVYAMWRRYGDRWLQSTVPAASGSMRVPLAAGDRPLEEVALAAVDRAGNLSVPSVWRP